MSSVHRTPVTSWEHVPLTFREKEVVDLIAEGLTTQGIAKKLYISEHTARSHVRNAMEKVGARTRAQLVALVICDHRSFSA